jgi:hypothetical protein
LVALLSQRLAIFAEGFHGIEQFLRQMLSQSLKEAANIAILFMQFKKHHSEPTNNKQWILVDLNPPIRLQFCSTSVNPPLTKIY